MECPCNKPGLHGKEGPFCFLCPIYRRSLAVQKARVDFLKNVTMGLGWIHGCDDTVELGSFQALVCGVCEMALWPWLYRLALWLFSLMWKRRNYPSNAGFHSRNIQFAVHFTGWNSMHASSAQRARGNTLLYFPQHVGEFEGGKRLGFLSWA